MSLHIMTVIVHRSASEHKAKTLIVPVQKRIAFYLEAKFEPFRSEAKLTEKAQKTFELWIREFSLSSDSISITNLEFHFERTHIAYI